ncbi:ribose-phosphate diphosphokinase [Microbulbifer sp. OS29]|uniref:ribose-phosphate diphosphokinase n=1 Tax=Microbulbifer okhotskensis TaxID=2926617 RepID=A0A9X2ENT3_9GAMM|nr:ribose-phosphate diphosphokinase [Microbulbifer okhotskensis]MCO1333033.1 ribose-phosphate diphosphokinase [Microbulbifer okhotskensis]
MSRLKLFSLDVGADFVGRVAASLGEPVSRHEERQFDDGEHKVRPLDDVEGADVFLVQSLYGDAISCVDQKIMRSLFFIGAVRDAGAARVTAVIPYLCYARKERRSHLRDPVPSRYLATFLEAAGVDVVVTMDVHCLSAFENGFRCRTVHLLSRSLFIEAARVRLCGDAGPLIVLSPDEGGIKRAEKFRLALSDELGVPVASAFVEKYRSGTLLSGGTLVGEVKDAAVLIVDDLLATGATICRAVQAVTAGGARRVLVFCAHGQFSRDAHHNMANLPVESVTVTNSLPQIQTSGHVEWVDCAPLIADCIRRIHDNGPVTELTI